MIISIHSSHIMSRGICFGTRIQVGLIAAAGHKTKILNISTDMSTHSNTSPIYYLKNRGDWT